MGATPAHCIYGRHRATPAFYVNRNMRQNGRIWVLGISKTGDTMQWAKFGDIWTKMAKKSGVNPSMSSLRMWGCEAMP